MENAVRLVEQDILASLRDRTFFALAELNAAIRPGVAALNAKPFTKREGSRASALAEERGYLKPLPATPYSYGQWKRAKVHLDYHVEIDKRFYSVPYTLIGKAVDVRVGAQALEIYHKGQRVAAHPLGYKPGDFVTQPEHMPEAHRQYRDRTQGRLQQRAAGIGPGTAAIIARQVTRKAHPEQTYRSSLGILRLAKDFSPAQLETACRRALELNILSYRGIRDLLTRGVGERVKLETPRVVHANVRGAAYFGDAHAH